MCDTKEPEVIIDEEQVERWTKELRQIHKTASRAHARSRDADQSGEPEKDPYDQAVEMLESLGARGPDTGMGQS